MELSFMEMVVIGVIAFVIFGPEELIRKAAQFGRFVGKMKAQVNNFRIMAEEEILRKDLMNDLNKKIDIERAIKNTMHPDPVDMQKALPDGTTPVVASTVASPADTSLESEIEKNIILIEKK